MPTAWNCLYLPLADANPVISTLQDSLTQLGYTLYNPFGSLPGKAYPRSVRVFVAPPSGGWVKVIGQLDERQLSQISQIAPCLYMTLQAKQANIRVYQAGTPTEPETAFVTHLKPGSTVTDIHNALHEKYPKLIPNEPQSSGLPFEALPDDVKAMAGGVNPGQAQKLFARLSGDLMKKVSPSDGQADAARDLVNNADAPDWNSAGGLQIRALMYCLTVPDNWREPDFTALRDAYQLHERRRRIPTARAYPGDEALMNQVPDALAYTPIYGGQNE